MILVWFVYGLAFFTLGLAILVYPKQRSAFKLAKDINLIAIFGILHGINEWLDMFIELEGPVDPEILRAVRMATLGGSFVFLVRFGTKVIADRHRNLRAIQALPVVLMGAWLVVLAVSSRPLLTGDVLGRYLLCAPGAGLTALGLFLYVPQFRKTKVSKAVFNLQIAGGMFVLYAILAGVIVKKTSFFPASVINYDFFSGTFGFPIQICRAMCAVVLAICTTNLLSIFRWETREALRRSEERCGMIASSAPIVLFVQDVNSVITFIQGKGLDGIGLDVEDVVGRTVGDVFPSVQQLQDDSRRALNGEEFVARVTVDGVVFEFCYAPLRDREGEIIGVIGVALDVTIRVKAQQELDKYRRQVEKNARLAEIGNLSSIMAQQLEEPLAVTRLLLERIVTEVNDTSTAEAVGESLAKGLTEISRAGDILERFRDATDVAGRRIVAPLDIYQLAKRVMTTFAESAKNANLSISLKDMGFVAFMSMTGHELEQLFFILIQNAIDACDSDKRESLTISGNCSGKEIELQFGDTCRGVDEKDVDRIFEPFFVSGPHTGRAGLGLAMARQIVSSHGGSIRAESKPERGTTIFVSLPVERAY